LFLALGCFDEKNSSFETSNVEQKKRIISLEAEME
jgi:predicted RNase H-like nuclease (RuvC/YqgF family)